MICSEFIWLQAMPAVRMVYGFQGEGFGHLMPEVPLRNAWLIAKVVINYAGYREQSSSVNIEVGGGREGIFFLSLLAYANKLFHC